MKRSAILRLFVLLSAAVLLAVTMSGCALTDGQEAYRDARVHIVTTIFPPYDFASAVSDGAGGVAVQQLLRPGTESHTFDPTPADILAVQNCDIFIYTGGESDAWVDTLLEATENPGMHIIRMMDTVNAVEEAEIEGAQHSHTHDGHDHDVSHAHDSDHVEYDEHVWTDPHNAKQITAAITEVLCETDPGYADLYRENCADYLAELDALDHVFHEIAEQAVHRTVVFGDRFPMRYLCDAYGIGYRAAFPGCAAESEPGAATMIYLIEKVRAEQIPAIFTIEMSSGKIAAAIAEETGVQVLQMHSCHNRTADEAAAGKTYLDLMYENAQALEIALGIKE